MRFSIPKDPIYYIVNVGGDDMRNPANKHLGIEIDPELHYKLKYAAKYEERSGNGQILYLIENAYGNLKRPMARYPSVLKIPMEIIKAPEFYTRELSYFICLIYFRFQVRSLLFPEGWSPYGLSWPWLRPRNPSKGWNQIF